MMPRQNLSVRETKSLASIPPCRGDSIRITKVAPSMRMIRIPRAGTLNQTGHPMAPRDIGISDGKAKGRQRAVTTGCPPKKEIQCKSSREVN
jgi:hypothetical protein